MVRGVPPVTPAFASVSFRWCVPFDEPLSFAVCLICSLFFYYRFHLDSLAGCVCVCLCLCLCLCVCVCVWPRVNEREWETVLCLRFAETGRGFADKRSEDMLQHSMIITREEEEKRKEEEAEEEEKKKKSTKDLPGLSLYTSPPSFHWLMAHKWKQTF